MIWAVLSFVGLGLVIGGLNASDKARYRRGNVPFCRIHKRGGMWFFHIGRFGGSFYVTKHTR